MKEHIFVSYSSRDLELIQSITSAFEHAGFSYWIDKKDIIAGNKWRNDISKAIKNCSLCLILLTNKSSQSDEVRVEIEYARRNNKKLVFLQVEEIEQIEGDLDMLLGHYHSIIEIGSPISVITNRILSELKKILIQQKDDSNISVNNNLDFELKKGVDFFLKLEFEKAFQILESIENKSSEAQFYLGEMYLLGRGRKKNISQAKLFFDKAIKNGNEKGYFGLAQIFEEKDEFKEKVNEYYEKSFKALFESSLNGDLYSSNLVGILYHDGKGVTKSVKKAFKCYKDAANGGYVTAQYNLGYIYESGADEVLQDIDEAFRWYLKAATNGSNLAQVALGRLYRDGKGIEEADFEKAFFWFNQAAKQGNWEALRELGVLYHAGKGTEQSFEKAIDCLLKANEYGDTKALSWLGLMYEYGDGVEQSYEIASRYYKQALDLDENDDLALLQLGLIYYNGNLNKPDYLKALNYFKMASKNKSYNGALAYYNLGRCYENGNGCDKNPSKAYECYLMSAEANNIDAQFKLGECYEGGLGIDQNLKKAFDWYLKSAIQGHAQSQHYVADYYYWGAEDIGIYKNINEAIKWYKKAANQNYSASQCSLGEICDYIYKDQKNAIEWYKIAVSNNNSKAKYKLGLYYLENSNHKNGFVLIEEAANEGLSDANYITGLIYESGLYDIKKDINKAFFHMNQAASYNHVKAFTKLGWFYQNGIGAVRDLHEASLYYNDAINQKKPDFNAYGYLGWLYEKGLVGGMKNDLANQYYSIGFKNKDLFSTGVIYELGLNGQFKNINYAVQYYKEASIKDLHPLAEYRIALILLNYAQSDDDLKALKSWLEKSSEKGLYEAQVLLKEIANLQ